MTIETATIMHTPEPEDLSELHANDVCTLILVSDAGESVGLDNMAPHTIDVCLLLMLQQRKDLVGLSTEGEHLLAHLSHRLV